jgi:hypothetical protein
MPVVTATAEPPLEPAANRELVEVGLAYDQNARLTQPV